MRIVHEEAEITVLRVPVRRLRHLVPGHGLESGLIWDDLVRADVRGAGMTQHSTWVTQPLQDHWVCD